jgi:hypothetical protein
VNAGDRAGVHVRELSFSDVTGAAAYAAELLGISVASRDNAIGTKVERIMAKRIHAHTIEIKGASHVVMISHL